MGMTGYIVSYNAMSSLHVNPDGPSHLTVPLHTRPPMRPPASLLLLLGTSATGATHVSLLLRPLGAPRLMLSCAFHACGLPTLVLQAVPGFVMAKSSP